MERKSRRVQTQNYVLDKARGLENMFSLSKRPGSDILSLVEKDIKSIKRGGVVFFFSLFFQIFSVDYRSVELSTPSADFGDPVRKEVAEK